MTRSSQVTHALSAMQNERATRAQSEQASMKFLIARAGAASAPIEDHAADTRTADLAARRKIAIECDDLDAERWLDEGGRDGTEEISP